MNPTLEAIFGNRTAMLVLLFLENYGEGHALRISKTFDIGLNMTQRQLKRFEGNGVLNSRMVGSARIYKFNDRSPTMKNLRSFLASELELLPKEFARQYLRQRQRPRRAGKPL